MALGDLAPNRQNHEYTRGLPQPAKPWRKPDGIGFRIPGDPETDRERCTILSRYDPQNDGASAAASSTRPALDWTNLPRPDASHDNIANIKWLKTVTHNNCYSGKVDMSRASANTPADWHYAQRREAQEVTPFIYLGPANVAKDEAFLRSKQITMILIVKDPKVLPSILLESRTAERMGLEVQKLDFNTSRLVSKFEEAVEKINTHLAQQYSKRQAAERQRTENRVAPDDSLPARILVYDLTGTEVAATVVGAYLVAMYGCKAWECTFLIHSKRFCVNAQFIQEYMVRWYDMVEARKQTRMAQAPLEGSLPAPPTARPKRPVDVDQELDDFARFTVDAAGSAGAYSGSEGGRRQIAAPFADHGGSQDFDMA